ncbi:NAD(P)-binding protein [Mycena crocata]|nr:NAD(P)-binding protein [Mycena crocata]
MTIVTQTPSAPLVAVVGATGNQGGSVVKALAESALPYRVRAFTRDAAKPAARKLAGLGVEVVGVEIVVGNKDAVYKAFDGVDVAFLVTNLRDHGSGERETAEGILMIDAAKAGGATRIVWSGLPSISALSNGKQTHVYHYDSKARVTTHGRACGVPFVDVQAGFYTTNFGLMSGAWMQKQPTSDGEGETYAISFPVQGSMLFPIIDTPGDYGLFVRKAIEAEVFPDGGEVVAHGERISGEEMARQVAEATGKNVKFAQISVEQFATNHAKAGVPPKSVVMMTDLFSFYAEHGWTVNNGTDGLGRRPRTWKEFAQTADWSRVLA